MYGTQLSISTHQVQISSNGSLMPFCLPPAVETAKAPFAEGYLLSSERSRAPSFLPAAGLHPLSAFSGPWPTFFSRILGYRSRHVRLGRCVS